MAETGGTFDDPDGTTEAVRPVPEKYYLPVFAYRGTQQHGVNVPDQPWLPQDGGEEGWNGTPLYEQEPIPIAPVPVYIVDDGGRQVRTWRAYQTVVGTTPAQLIGRDTNRKQVTIRNLHASFVLFIGRANYASTLDGYPLDPGQSISLGAEDEVWGISTGEGVYVAILVEGWL